MEESPQLTAEQDKRETVHCIIWASVVVFGMLALLLHGLAFLSWTEPTMEEIYDRRRMDNSIKAMKGQIEHLEELYTGIAITWAMKQNRLESEHQNHKHHFWTGKVK